MIREIKGSEMQMIRVRTADSRVFSEAFFVLRRSRRKTPICDMVAEAQRIIRDCSSAGVIMTKSKPPLRTFLIGVFSGVAVCSIFIAIAALCMME